MEGNIVNIVIELVLFEKKIRDIGPLLYSGVNRNENDSLWTHWSNAYTIESILV